MINRGEYECAVSEYIKQLNTTVLLHGEFIGKAGQAIKEFVK